MSFSERTMKFLKEAGWTPERSKDTSLFRRKLTDDGYSYPECVDEFLKSFGGLELRQPAFRVPNAYDTLHFDPFQASYRTFRERIETYEKRVGEPLTIIGEAYNGYLVLVMTPTGKVYGGYDNFLAIYGKDYEEAIENIYQCIKTPEIP